MAKVVKPTKKEQSTINTRLAKKYPGRKYKIKKSFVSGLKARMKKLWDTRSTAVGKGARAGNAISAKELAKFSKKRK